MNERSERSEKLSMEARLERLVDGEFSSDEYRTLLAALDEEPGAWRQCAMAFLESQALKQEFGQVHSLLDVPPQESVGRKALPKTNEVWKTVQMLLAIAASFLIAFGLGLALPSILHFGQEGDGGGNIKTGSPLIVSDGDNSEDGNIEGSAADAVRYVGDVRLLVDSAGDGAEEAGHVPVYEVGQDVTGFLAGETPALGPEMLELLRQSGYEVRHDQQYFPAPLDDGRQIIVPVEGYQITPVSRRY
jgi:hypothetical protein